jgi:hypothetical protein
MSYLSPTILRCSKGTHDLAMTMLAFLSERFFDRPLITLFFISSYNLGLVYMFYMQVIPNFKDVIQRMHPEAVAKRLEEEKQQRAKEELALKIEATASLQHILPVHTRATSSSLIRVSTLKFCLKN